MQEHVNVVSKAKWNNKGHLQDVLATTIREVNIEDRESYIEDQGSRIRFRYRILSTFAFHRSGQRETIGLQSMARL